MNPPSMRLRPIALLPLLIFIGLLAGCAPVADDAVMNSSSASSSVPSGSADEALLVYFSNDVLNPGAADCSAVFPVTRSIAETEDKPLAAMRELFGGPTDEEKTAGYSSFFSGETANAIKSVRIENATAYVDLEDIRAIIPNASSSCGSASLLSQIESTLKELPGVDRVILAIDGDPAAFYDWLQIGCSPENDQCDSAPFRNGDEQR